MLFLAIPRAMAGRGICIAAQKSNKPRKRLLKGKQMFVYKFIEKKVLVAGKGERERISGVATAWCMVVVRFEPFGLKMRRLEAPERLPFEQAHESQHRIFRLFETDGLSGGASVCKST